MHGRQALLKSTEENSTYLADPSGSLAACKILLCEDIPALTQGGVLHPILLS